MKKITFNELKNHVYQDDTNCCTVISASIIFNKNYEDTHLYFAQNGRKTGKGVSWSKYSKIMTNLAKLEGFKLQKFEVSPWDIDSGQTTWAFIDKESKSVETIVKNLKTKTAITTNNFRKFLPKGDYIVGMSGHVASIINGEMQDWTYNRAKRICYIWKVEKLNKKVKALNLFESSNDFSEFV